VLFASHSNDTSLGTSFGKFLSSLGFAPIDTNHLTTIIKIGWILVVTAFKPIELLGLALYLAFFWTLPVWLYFAYGIEPEGDGKRKDEGQFGLTANDRRRLAIPVCTLALLGWLVLFGGAASKNAAILGAILSGVLFLLFAMRAFQRVRPIYDPDPNFLRVAKLTGLSLLQIAGGQIKDGTIKTRTAIILNRRFFKPVARFYRFLALSTRGRRGRNRIYMFVLGEYVGSLVLLAAATIFFWAMADRAVLAPTGVRLSYFIGLTLSSIFSSVSPVASPAELPRFMAFGPVISAWILFVLYIGPASSNLASRQEAYAKSVSTAHGIFRKFFIHYRQYLRFLDSLEKKLSSEKKP